MPFILQPEALYKLSFIRDHYEQTKQVNLSASTSFFKLPVVLGGTDLDKRRSQIEFLEKLRVVLSANIFKEGDIKTPEELVAHVTAARIMLAASLYVKEQIATTYTLTAETNSVLYSQIDNNLGITPENYLDEHDQETCIYAAKRLTTSSISALDDANVALLKANLKPISEKEWAQFTDYLCTKSNAYSSVDPYAKYPITKVTEKFFGTVGLWTGLTLGYVIGDTVTQSKQGMTAKTKLAAVVGGTLLLFKSTGPAGVAILAPLIAERLIATFFKISLAHILGSMMKVAGRGIGLGVGLPLDTGIHLVSRGFQIASDCAYPSETSSLSGLRISDGVVVLHGVPVEIVADAALPAHKKVVEIKIQAGKLFIDNEEVAISDEVLKQLEVNPNQSVPPVDPNEGIMLR